VSAYAIGSELGSLTSALFLQLPDPLRANWILLGFLPSRAIELVRHHTLLEINQ
jgi:hypothetical protein